MHSNGSWHRILLEIPIARKIGSQAEEAASLPWNILETTSNTPIKSQKAVYGYRSQPWNNNLNLSFPPLFHPKSYDSFSPLETIYSVLSKEKKEKRKKKKKDKLHI